MHVVSWEVKAMADIKHIAFPVDFSDRCNGTVPFVQGMASRYGAKVTSSMWCTRSTRAAWKDRR